MIYLITVRRGGGHGVHVEELRDDLSARRHAAAMPEAIEVETRDGRVVWRRVPEETRQDASAPVPSAGT